MSQTWNEQLVQAQKKIFGFQKGQIFHLRDCLSHPQALWGKWFFEEVQRGTVPNVVFRGKDHEGVIIYQKV